jgi:hypothetical protein
VNSLACATQDFIMLASFEFGSFDIVVAIHQIPSVPSKEKEGDPERDPDFSQFSNSKQRHSSMTPASSQPPNVTT